MGRGLALLILAAAVHAAPDPVKAYRATLRRLAAREETFWREFNRRGVEANRVRMEPYRDMIRAMNGGKKGTSPDLAVDLSLYAVLYEDMVKLERARGDAAKNLLASGHAQAAKRVMSYLLETADAIEETEAVLWKNKVSGGWGSFDQRPGVKRHGLAVRRDLLVAALSAEPAYLATHGWQRAVKADGSRHVRRRVAVLDALGRAPLAGRQRLVENLRAREIALRIVALENLAPSGAEVFLDLEPELDAPCPLVRRALLAAIRHHGGSFWIAPVLKRYPRTAALERDECVATLAVLTRQKFGDDAEAWRAWFEKHRAAIEANRFDARNVEVQEVKTREQPVRTAFYGIPTSSRGIIFVVEGGLPLLLPADVALARSKSFWDWVIGNPEWKREHVRHKEVLQEQLAGALKRLHPETRFGVITFMDGFKVKRIGERRMLKNNTRDLKAARRFLDVHAPKGFRSVLANLATAMEMAGLDPKADHALGGPQADTVYVFSDGSMRGGRFLYVAAELAAFERLNRFRRLVVHTIRMASGGSHSEELMKGYAASTGGTYHRFRKP